MKYANAICTLFAFIFIEYFYDSATLCEAGNFSMSDIYQILDDGRILEFKLGRDFNQDSAIWARNLSAQEKTIYLKLKSLGYSDSNIYYHLNQHVEKNPTPGF